MRQRLLRLVRETVGELGASPRVLELGAGHGAYSAELLATGAHVTLVEMSPPGLSAALRTCRTNPRFHAILDREADLRGLHGGFDLALVLSVLHHVPDYLSLVDRILGCLEPGGTLLTLQDPLFYPRCSVTTRRVDRASYLTWRLRRGELAAGLRAGLRRARGEYPEQRPRDLTYYHVVRQGVDEVAVLDLVRPRFERVELLAYWSNHLGAAARLAESMDLKNTFAVSARGFLG